jgi:voltage-gated potassium channel
LTPGVIRKIRTHPLIYGLRRALRLLRLARLASVATEGVRLSRYRLASKGAAYALGVAVVVTLASAALVEDAERTRGFIRPFGDAVWWAMTTFATTG